MSFARSKQILPQQNQFYPPPGYYQPTKNQSSLHALQFNRDERFKNKVDNHNPGPGSYMNHDKQILKRRLLQQGNKKQPRQFSSNNNQIKISSIPSIPKKSSTRVYQQLAPGILILHEQQYQNSSIGPGTYDPNSKLIQKSSLGVKIHPQPRKRLVLPQQPQAKVPTMAQQLRQQRRLLYKQNLIKSTNFNKNDINSSDLCLQTIILREKLLRGEDNPAPGHYYNEEFYSIFKRPDMDKPLDLQALGGKEQRFKQRELLHVGPGAYTIKSEIDKKGGVIPKNNRQDIQFIKKINQPGPGAYKIVALESVKQEPKGNYPPIFGSGCKRFSSAPKPISEGPGPGAYKIQKRRQKKTKYIKIRKDFYQSQPSIPPQYPQLNNPLLMTSHPQKTLNSMPPKRLKNTHNFKSKVDRFLNNSEMQNQTQTGPGKYQVNHSSFTRQTFNTKKAEGYVGAKAQRFDDSMVRPHVGPGTYY